MTCTCAMCTTEIACLHSLLWSAWRVLCSQCTSLALAKRLIQRISLAQCKAKRALCIVVWGNRRNVVCTGIAGANSLRCQACPVQSACDACHTTTARSTDLAPLAPLEGIGSTKVYADARRCSKRHSAAGISKLEHVCTRAGLKLAGSSCTPMMSPSR